MTLRSRRSARQWAPFAVASVLVLGAMFIGCGGSDNDNNGTPDAGQDVGTGDSAHPDAGRDARSDGGTDATDEGDIDSGNPDDAGVDADDASPDSSDDAATDAGADVSEPVDASDDAVAESDASDDASEDASEDVTEDVTDDVTEDASVDATDDVVEDAPDDASLDASKDATSDGPPVGPPGSCTSNTDCESTDYCALPASVCAGFGTCTEKPGICPGIVSPVCGCDGATYSNSCKAERAGVNVAHTGGC